MRIQNRQLRREKGVLDIPQVRKDCVLYSDRYRVPRFSAGMELSRHGDGGISRTKSEQRELLQYQPRETSWRNNGRPCFREGRTLHSSKHALQRPVVPKQQYERESDDLGLGHQPQSIQKCNDKITANSRSRRIPAISAEREQKEERAQQVLALSNPDHALDVDRMQGEERSHHCAATNITRRPPQHLEEQQHVHHVPKQVYLVVAARIEDKELAIQSMRKPGKRVPIVRIKGRGRPFDGVPTQTHGYVRVLINVE